MDKISLAQEIVIFRGKKGMTQQELADAVKTTQRTVVAWESGSSIPRKAMKVRIAQAFGLADDYFWDEHDRALVSTKKEDTGEKKATEVDDCEEVMKKLEAIMNENGSSITTEQKKLCLQACKGILSMK